MAAFDWILRISIRKRVDRRTGGRVEGTGKVKGGLMRSRKEWTENRCRGGETLCPQEQGNLGWKDCRNGDFRETGEELFETQASLLCNWNPARLKALTVVTVTEKGFFLL